jgi:DNA polymerase III epsilon subunit-like protein
MEKLLVASFETSGLNVANTINIDRNISNHYQILSAGLIVCDKNFKKIDELYVEIKWDGNSLWDSKAEKFHGFSKTYLKDSGLKEMKAVELIGNFIVDHFEDDKIRLIGHNTHFALTFLDSLFRRYDINLPFDPHYLDMSTLGYTFLGKSKKFEIFNILGIKNDNRNALNTSRNILKSFKLFKKIMDR